MRRTERRANKSIHKRRKVKKLRASLRVETLETRFLSLLFFIIMRLSFGVEFARRDCSLTLFIPLLHGFLFVGIFLYCRQFAVIVICCTYFPLCSHFLCHNLLTLTVATVSSRFYLSPNLISSIGQAVERKVNYSLHKIAEPKEGRRAPRKNEQARGRMKKPVFGSKVKTKRKYRDRDGMNGRVRKHRASGWKNDAERKC